MSPHTLHVNNHRQCARARFHVIGQSSSLCTLWQSDQSLQRMQTFCFRAAQCQQHPTSSHESVNCSGWEASAASFFVSTWLHHSSQSLWMSRAIGFRSWCLASGSWPPSSETSLLALLLRLTTELGCRGLRGWAQQFWCCGTYSNASNLTLFVAYRTTPGFSQVWFD